MNWKLDKMQRVNLREIEVQNGIQNVFGFNSMDSEVLKMKQFQSETNGMKLKWKSIMKSNMKIFRELILQWILWSHFGSNILEINRPQIRIGKSHAMYSRRALGD